MIDGSKSKLVDVEGLDSDWGDLDAQDIPKVDETPSGDLDITGINPFAIAQQKLSPSKEEASAKTNSNEDSKCAKHDPSAPSNAIKDLDDLSWNDGEDLDLVSMLDSKKSDDSSPNPLEKVTSEQNSEDSNKENAETSSKSEETSEANTQDSEISESPKIIPPEPKEGLVLAAGDSSMEFEGIEAYEPEMSEDKKRRREPTSLSIVQMDFDEPRRFPRGILVLIIVLVLLVLGLASFMLMQYLQQEAPAPTDSNPVVEEPHVQEESTLVRIKGIMEISDTQAQIFINGIQVPHNPQNAYEFLAAKENTIAVYSEGKVPFYTTLPLLYDFSQQPIRVDFDDDALFLHGDIILKFENPADKDAIVRIDGKIIENVNDPIKSVILGFPHHIVVEKEGMAKCLFIHWPMYDRISGNTLNIPKLQPVENFASKTEVKLVTPESMAEARVSMKLGDEIVNPSDLQVLTKNDYLYYRFSRRERHDLEYAIESGAFERVQLLPSLQMKSRGVVKVQFLQPKNEKRKINICFVRVGEVVCPDMEAPDVIPSGIDWIVVAYFLAEDGSREILRGSYSQDLLMNRKIEFAISVDKGTFSMKVMKGFTEKLRDR